MPKTITSPTKNPVTKTKSQPAQPWQVVVLDDPVNLMGYVTLILKRVFGYDQAKAEHLMLQVHNAGKAIVWTGNRERAEMYVAQLHQFQLKAALEKAGE